MKALSAVMLLLVCGCPEGVTPPAPPPARPCSTAGDCLPEGGALCGPIIACVDGFCEGEPSRVEPCP